MSRDGRLIALALVGAADMSVAALLPGADKILGTLCVICIIYGTLAWAYAYHELSKEV